MVKNKWLKIRTDFDGPMIGDISYAAGFGDIFAPFLDIFSWGTTYKCPYVLLPRGFVWLVFEGCHEPVQWNSLYKRFAFFYC